MKKKPEDKNDLEECKEKIDELLKEYNCSIESEAQFGSIYLSANNSNECVDII